MFREIFSFAQLNFVSFSISFCRRTCSKVCHALAALGASQSMSRCGWIKEVQDDVSVLDKGIDNRSLYLSTPEAR
jgi:hypothetical protein